MNKSRRRALEQFLKNIKLIKRKQKNLIVIVQQTKAMKKSREKALEQLP